MDNFQKFIDTETKIIEISKWIAGEKMGCDPGECYISKFIEKHAADLREAWNRSKCRTCKNKCLHNLRIFCEDYLAEDGSNMTT